jgi:hypothetical protein
MGGHGWVHIAQERDKWQALVNKVKKLGFHKMWEI